MERDFILYLSGGGMKGIFGAGVVTALEELDVYDRLKAVYSVSSGTFNGAFFLTRESVKGSSIYYEDLTNSFISSFNLLPGYLERILLGERILSLPTELVINAINIDFLTRIIQTNKRLNIEFLRKQQIPLYAKVLDIDSRELSYLDTREDPLRILEATATIAPYFSGFVEINGRRYIDGGIKEHLGPECILQKHPESKIIVVDNYPCEEDKHELVTRLEAHALSRMYSWSFRDTLEMLEMKRRNHVNDVSLARNNPNILFLSPNSQSQVTNYTTDAQTLLETYNFGINETKKRVPYFLE